MIRPKIEAFFDMGTHTVSYVVSDPNSRACAVIDTVLNYDPNSGRTSTDGADEIIDYVLDRNLEVEWILETHAHADHLTAAPYIQKKLGGKIAIGGHIPEVQKVFRRVFNLEEGFPVNGSQFDYLINDGDLLKIGAMTIRAMLTPGHTPACMTYVIEDAAFVGDTLFMPDYGTARCDFPGGSAQILYRSVQKIYALPDDTRIFLCHDYLPEGREAYKWETTVAEQKAHNIHVNESISEKAFVSMREKRDTTLDLPRLILPAIQVNIRAGNFPPPEDNGTHYLKIPLNKV